MKIHKILAEGELLNAEQLAKVTGGAKIKGTNSNNADLCHCEGTGNNVNHKAYCFCDSNMSSNSPCPDPTPANPCPNT